MTSIGELFPKCRKLAYDSRQQLRQVQNGVLHASELYLSLDELGRQLDIMDTLVQRETPVQREAWKQKILELREEAASIKRQAEHYDRIVNTNVRHQRERDELLSRRKRRTDNNENELNNLAEEGNSLSQSQMMVDDLIGSAQNNLSSLARQRDQMRGVNRFIFDISDRLDLTGTTMRIIERRDITDAYLVFGGMFVTIVVIYLCWFY